MNAFADAGTFLIQSLASIYLVIILLRFLLQLSRADFYNPVSQFAHKATVVFLGPMRRLFPCYRNIDIACLILALLVQWLAIQLSIFLDGYSLLNVFYILWWGALGILSMLINFYLYGLLAAIILSWVAPHNPHPAIMLLWQLMEPVMAPFRRIVPSLGGLDLSPILIFLILNVLRIFLTHIAAASSLPDVGGFSGVSRWGWVPGI